MSIRIALVAIFSLILAFVVAEALAGTASAIRPAKRYAIATDNFRNVERQAQCLDEGVRILAVSGHGAAAHDGYGLLTSTVDSVVAAIPGSTNFSIPFPKNNEDQGAAVVVGVDHLTSSIEAYGSNCPETPIVLMGYSQGAIITMNTLCGRSRAGQEYETPLPSEYAANILAVIIYGDETRVPDQSYDEGTCTDGKGIIPRANPGGCAAFEAAIQSYCDKSDPQCCRGTNQSVHYTYATTYDSVATQFVVDQYTARQYGDTVSRDDLYDGNNDGT